MTGSPKESIADKIVADFTADFDLGGEEYVKALRDVCVNALAGYHISTTPPKGGKKEKKEKKPRKTTAYNAFVQEKMKLPDIQSLGHKERMSAIGKLWKDVDEAGKKQYQELADKANADLAKTESEPAKEEPAKEEPVKEKKPKKAAKKDSEPAKEEPAKEEPAKEEPAKEKKPKKAAKKKD